MKQNGLNVAADFLLNLNLTGCEGGLVLVVADDPGALSSSNEEDSRGFARLGDLPLLEPATFQEAKEMTRRYRITGVPTLVIDGKYTVGIPRGSDFERMFAVTDHLVTEAAE